MLLNKKDSENIGKSYEQHVDQLESKNVENVEHYKMLCQHLTEIIAQKASKDDIEKCAEFKDRILQQIDPSLPPYFIPNMNLVGADGLNDSTIGTQSKIEPYSELEDYLDRDDLGNLLGVLGHFADNTASGLLSIGGGILN